MASPGGTAPPAPPPPAASLVGEQLAAQGSNTIINPCVGASGTTVPFNVQGQAFGPYSGIFTEQGTFTYSSANGFIIGFQSSFQITSAAGTVTGTKATSGTAFHGFCTGTTIALATQVTYQATIVTPGGTFTDSGTGAASISAICTPSACQSPPASLFETFVTSDGVLPVDTTGKATGGGQLDGASGPKVTFGFEAKQGAQGLSGRCNVLDHASGTMVRCLDVTSYQQTGDTATWTGNAEVDGTPQQYRITVQDNGEPNQGVDTFAIDTSSYDAGGRVARGDVQLHS